MQSRTHARSHANTAQRVAQQAGGGEVSSQAAAARRRAAWPCVGPGGDQRSVGMPSCGPIPARSPPAQIRTLRALKSLSVAGNRLAALPSSLGGCTVRGAPSESSHVIKSCSSASVTALSLQLSDWRGLSLAEVLSSARACPSAPLRALTRRLPLSCLQTQIRSSRRLTRAIMRLPTSTLTSDS